MYLFQLNVFRLLIAELERERLCVCLCVCMCCERGRRGIENLPSSYSFFKWIAIKTEPLSAAIPETISGSCVGNRVVRTWMTNLLWDVGNNKWSFSPLYCSKDPKIYIHVCVQYISHNIQEGFGHSPKHIWMDIGNIVCLYNAILFSFEKEGNVVCHVSCQISWQLG